MYIVYKYIVYAHICTVQCECILQSLYAQHSASAHPMRTQCTPGVQCTTPHVQCAPGVHCTPGAQRMHAHIDTKSTSSDGTGAGKKEIIPHICHEPHEYIRVKFFLAGVNVFR